MASIVDWMNGQKQDSSYANRAKLAAQYGIGGYQGTASQNLLLLSKLQAAKSKATAPKATVKANTKQVSAPKPVSAPAPSAPKAPAAPSLAQLTTDYFNQLAGGINSQFDQDKAAQIAQLQAANKAAIDPIQQKLDALPAQYYASKNQADVVANQNANRTKEMMAANGLSASGENVTANIANSNARLKSLNDLNTQQQADTANYQHQIDQINDPAKQNALVAQVEAQRTAALNQARQSADQTMYQRAQDSKNYSLQQQQLALQKSSASASQKLAQQQFSFQKSQATQAQKWQKYTYDHMSAAQKKQFAQNSQQFGDTKAFQLYSLQQTLAEQSSSAQSQLDAYQALLNGSGFNGGGTSSSGNAAYQNNLKAAQKAYNIPQSAVPALNWIIQHESGFNPSAKNKSSSAHGYGQFINSTAASMEKKYGVSYGSPVNQIYLTYRYMVDRYGSPQKAMAFWQKNHWY